MKRGLTTLTIFLFLIAFASAETCNVKTSLLNQDPYPAVPGDYIKLVFQVEGLDNPSCGDTTFELLEDYPLKFNPGETGIKKLSTVSYLKDYESNILVPYEIRVDENALDGANPIEVRIVEGISAPILQTFNLEVEDTRADFETYIKDFNYQTNTLTIEILNIADSDVKALSVEIPKQQNIVVKGSERQVVGDLDSNEYTAADFEATPKEGEIKINLIYSDSINVRRTLEKTIQFDSSYFTNRKSDEKSSSGIWYAIIIAILIFAFIIYRRRKKKKEKHKHQHLHQH